MSSRTIATLTSRDQTINVKKLQFESCCKVNENGLEKSQMIMREIEGAKENRALKIGDRLEVRLRRLPQQWRGVTIAIARSDDQ